MWQFPPYDLSCQCFLKVKNPALLVCLHRSLDVWFCLLPSGWSPVGPWLFYSAALKHRHGYQLQHRTEHDYGIVLQTALLTYRWSVGFASFNITTLLTQVQPMTLTVSLDSLLQHCCQARQPPFFICGKLIIHILVSIQFHLRVFLEFVQLSLNSNPDLPCTCSLA